MSARIAWYNMSSFPICQELIWNRSSNRKLLVPLKSKIGSVPNCRDLETCWRDGSPLIPSCNPIETRNDIVKLKVQADPDPDDRSVDVFLP